MRLISKVTKEHLKHHALFDFIKNILNQIIDNVSIISLPQLNITVATVLHKGKGISLHNHKLYRFVSVTPLFERLFDQYVRHDI